MAHVAGRVVNDADSHLIESRGWLESYCSEYVRENLKYDDQRRALSCTTLLERQILGLSTANPWT